MKKSLTLIFLSFILLATGGCRQELLGAKHAVKNFITAPYRGIKGAVSNYNYSKLRERTERAEGHGISAGNGEDRCGGGGIDGVLGSGQENSLKELQELVRKGACECKAWGSCTVKECSCEKLCPDSLEIFNRRPLEENTSRENSLAFRNTPLSSSSYEMVQGFCWGHASVTSKFNRLAFFDKGKKPPFSLSSRDEEEQNKAIEYYKKKIDDIVDNKATDIEGFENLEDFSDHPALQGYIGDKVATGWADRAMTFQGMKTAVKSSPASKKENKDFFEQVKRKVDNHQQPQIVFTKKGVTGFTHAVLVSHYIIENGKTVLCVRDNNTSPYANGQCRNRMTLKSGGDIHYASPFWGDLGGVKVAHNDNQDAVAQVSALVERCKKDKDC